MFRKITLKSGLRVIVVPQKSTQAVTVLVLVGTGSKYERKEVSGISHFLEHMYFKGTKRRPSAIAVAETLDKIGGIYNAFTGEDYTGYFAKVDSSHWQLALDWVSEIYFNSLLLEKEIEKERGVIIEEINMYHDHPMNYIGILWSKLLYGDQPAGWPITGSKESVSRISRQDLINYMRNQYVAQNTIVCLAGRINPEKAIKSVEKAFAKVRKTKPIKKPKVVERQVKPECLLEQRSTDQTHFCLGTRAYNLFHPQRYTQEILAVILGGMMSSRLFVEVREKRGIAYYINTRFESDPDTGYLVTQAGVDNNRIEEAILLILKEYKKLTQKKVAQTELKKAKDYLKGKMALLLETSDAQASFYSFQELLEKRILRPKEIYHQIDKVNQNDILRVARDVFRPEKLNLALIGPFEDKTSFQRLLKI